MDKKGTGPPDQRPAQNTPQRAFGWMHHEIAEQYNAAIRDSQADGGHADSAPIFSPPSWPQRTTDHETTVPSNLRNTARQTRFINTTVSSYPSSTGPQTPKINTTVPSYLNYPDHLTPTNNIKLPSWPSDLAHFTGPIPRPSKSPYFSVVSDQVVQQQKPQVSHNSNKDNSSIMEPETDPDVLMAAQALMDLNKEARVFLHDAQGNVHKTTSDTTEPKVDASPAIKIESNDDVQLKFPAFPMHGAGGGLKESQHVTASSSPEPNIETPTKGTYPVTHDIGKASSADLPLRNTKGKRGSMKEPRFGARSMIPVTMDEANPADLLLWYLKGDEHEWEKIRAVWKEMTGQETTLAVLANRYKRIKEAWSPATDPNLPDDVAIMEAAKAEVEEDMRDTKWIRVAHLIKRRTGRYYAPSVLATEYERLHGFQ